MKMCESHWNDLREAIESRGLWHLVGKNGEEATAKFTAYQATEEPKYFEPLMAAHMSIISYYASHIGIDNLRALGETPVCPLCDAGFQSESGGLSKSGSLAEAWIEAAADDAFNIAYKAGALTKQ